MDNLPIELIQVINDNLDFFDQLKFKSICQLYHKNINIKQYIPQILIDIHPMFEESETRYFIPLNKFYSLTQKYPDIIKSTHNTTYSIHIMIPYKRAKYPSIDLVGGSMYFDRDIDDDTYTAPAIDFNMKTFIKECLDITNLLLTEKDVI
ncbi:hypothetical protein Klosneuvirus_4_102 [Klosneuvirus KNV1]|uniref:F-box domain-containing protein n=1 Tax=Klosneuvirus KNV1 TaxID=1977640 RepID=A0A1V0SKN4_9VIRU|nr:hypothetical protein Klosneuvirus_4_102 [Klosneuvirus KNV1]